MSKLNIGTGQNERGDEQIKLDLQYSLVNFAEAAEELEKVKRVQIPDFARFETDFTEIKRIAKIYQHYQNLIVVGNGGAINSFRGFSSCLQNSRGQKGTAAGKKVYILNTIEPDLIQELKESCQRENSLVLIVSKSGANPVPLEIMFMFWEYPKLVVCTEGLGALYQIVKREKIDYLKYPSHKEFPHLDDRHTGISASGLVPAALLGIDVEMIYAGAKEMHGKCAPMIPVKENPALQLATAFYLLERKGYEQIFCPVYSTKLSGFLPLMIQFLHATVCKEGKGQSIFGDLAAESQHHTNQRLFGGKKNILAFFITAGQEDQRTEVKVPLNLTDIPLRGGILKDLAGIPCSKLLEFEFQGTVNDAVEKGIPVVQLHLEKITPFSVGQFLGLFQYLAIYSAYLRGVDPYGQPQVERSKEISFELIKKYSGEKGQ